VPQYGVSCHTCMKTLWEGDDQPDDGQIIATEWADTHCPRADCPHTTQAVAERARQKPATRADLESILTRLDALERKTRP
jgi:hypothetical protein